MGIQSESKLSLKTFLVDEGENKFAGESSRVEFSAIWQLPKSQKRFHRSQKDFLFATDLSAMFHSQRWELFPQFSVTKQIVRDY